MVFLNDTAGCLGYFFFIFYFFFTECVCVRERLEFASNELKNATSLWVSSRLL